MSRLGSSFYITGGTLPRDASSYVERTADAELLARLRVGQFCYVLTSRQMGKSSLMVQTVARLRHENVVCAVIDLTAIGQNLDVERWYGGILNRLAEQVEMEHELEEFWFSHPEMSPLNRLLHALGDVVLKAKTESIVIFIDEIDAVRSLPFSADEFFAAIRSCHNRRAEDTKFERLTFCLLGVATPSDLIQDTRTTPFNIGSRIDLSDFTLEESRPLVGGMTTSNSNELLKRVMYWTAGHPYLTQRLCQAVASDSAVRTNGDVDRVCREVFFCPEARDQNDNLLFVRDRLLRSEVGLVSLLETYRAVLCGRQVQSDETDPVKSVLRLSGIVRSERNLLLPRNRIYSTVFDRRWVANTLPGEEVRRQRTAARRAALKVGTLAGVVVIALASLALYAFSQSSLARRNEAKAIAAGKLERQARLDADHNAAGRTTALKEANRQKGIAEAGSREARLESKKAIAAAQKLAKALQAESAATARAERQTAQLRLSEARTDAQRDRAEKFLYLANMRIAGQEWQIGNAAAVISLLAETRQNPHRQFEWFYWLRKVYPTGIPLNLKGHTHSVYSATFSPEGKSIITKTLYGVVKIWDSASGRERFALQLDTGGEVGFQEYQQTFSPDGKHLATPVRDASAMILDTATGREVLILKGHANNSVYSVAYSPDGKRLATASRDRTAKIWDTTTGSVLSTLKGHLDGVRRVAFSPDGKRIVTASTDKTVRIWDAASGIEILTMSGRAESVYELVITPNGQRVITISRDGEAALPNGAQGACWAEVWDVGTGRQVFSVRTDGPIAVSPDGEKIAACSRAINSVKVMDVATNTEILRLPMDWSALDQFALVNGVAFSADGRRIAACSWDNMARVWDATTGGYLHSFKGGYGHLMALAFSPNGNRLATAGWDHSTRVWDVSGASGEIILRGHTGVSHSAIFSPNGKLIVTAGDDHTAKIWDAATGGEVRTLKGHTAGLLGAAFSPDGKLVATASEDKLAKIWDVATGEELLTLKGHTWHVTSFAFAPNGKRFATSSTDGTIRIWDTVGHELLAVRSKDSGRDREGTFMSVVFSPDGKRFAGAGNGRVQIFDAVTGAEIADFRAHQDRIRCIAYSPDGKRLATASNDMTARIWDASTGKNIVNLIGHTGEVQYIAFSPDGKRVGTASLDDTARLWDAATGREVLNVLGYGCISFSLDGKRVAIGNGNYDVEIWDIASEAQVARWDQETRERTTKR